MNGVYSERCTPSGRPCQSVVHCAGRGSLSQQGLSMAPGYTQDRLQAAWFRVSTTSAQTRSSYPCRKLLRSYSKSCFCQGFFLKNPTRWVLLDFGFSGYNQTLVIIVFLKGPNLIVLGIFVGFELLERTLLDNVHIKQISTNLHSDNVLSFKNS